MRRRAGPVSEILVFVNRNFSHINTRAQIPGLSMIKHFQLRMACKVADKSERGSVVFWGPFSHPRSRFLGCHAMLHPKEAAADIRTAFLSLYWPIIGRVPFLGTLSRQTRIVQSETVFYHGPRVSSGESKTGAHI